MGFPNVYLVETWPQGEGLDIRKRSAVYYVAFNHEYSLKDVEAAVVRETGDFVKVQVLNGYKLAREGWKLAKG